MFLISGVHSDFPKVSSLSEIVIEDDKVELDSFLGPSGEADDAPGIYCQS